MSAAGGCWEPEEPTFKKLRRRDEADEEKIPLPCFSLKGNLKKENTKKKNHRLKCCQRRTGKEWSSGEPYSGFKKVS